EHPRLGLQRDPDAERAGLLDELGQAVPQARPALFGRRALGQHAREERDALRVERRGDLDRAPQEPHPRVRLRVHEGRTVLAVRVEEEPGARLDDDPHPGAAVRVPGAVAQRVHVLAPPLDERVEVREAERERDRAVALVVEHVERDVERVVREAVGAVPERERHRAAGPRAHVSLISARPGRRPARRSSRPATSTPASAATDTRLPPRAAHAACSGTIARIPAFVAANALPADGVIAASTCRGRAVATNAPAAARPATAVATPGPPPALARPRRSAPAPTPAPPPAVAAATPAARDDGVPCAAPAATRPTPPAAPPERLRRWRARGAALLRRRRRHPPRSRRRRPRRATTPCRAPRRATRASRPRCAPRAPPPRAARPAAGRRRLP